jgi:hypothetical protein
MVNILLILVLYVYCPFVFLWIKKLETSKTNNSREEMNRGMTFTLLKCMVAKIVGGKEVDQPKLQKEECVGHEKMRGSGFCAQCCVALPSQEPGQDTDEHALSVTQVSVLARF